MPSYYSQLLKFFSNSNQNGSMFWAYQNVKQQLGGFYTLVLLFLLQQSCIPLKLISFRSHLLCHRFFLSTLSLSQLSSLHLSPFFDSLNSHCLFLFIVSSLVPLSLLMVDSIIICLCCWGGGGLVGRGSGGWVLILGEF